MPNLTQKAYSRNLELARQEGRDNGFFLGRNKAEQEFQQSLKVARQTELTNLLREGAALAQANAKLTYSLQLLVEKVSKA